MKSKLLLFILFPLWSHANIDWEDLTEKICQTPEAFELTPIGEGGTNANYLLTLNECPYFIRIAPPSSNLLGASIEIEFEVLQALKDLNISPQPIHLNRNRKILVTEFMQGAKEVDLSDLSTRIKVFTLLHQIEASNITLSRTYHPYSDIARLIDLAKSLNDPIDYIPLPLLEQLSQTNEKKLSHFDLHHGNILTDNERLWIVDWEYATMADRFLTLASMASTEHWDDNQMKSILQEYLPHYTEEDYHSLFLNRIIIDLHWAAWCHVQKTLSPLEMPYEEWETAYLTEALNRIRTIK
jgi:thiamine kinase-like enzyme